MEKKKKWKILAIAKQYEGSVADLAKNCGIDEGHLIAVSQNRAELLATDLARIIEYTGLHWDEIETVKGNQ